jgi:uncharacterized membrane protein YgcG
VGSSCSEPFPPLEPSWAYPLLRLLCLSIFFVLSCLAAREIALTAMLKCHQLKQSTYSIGGGGGGVSGVATVGGGRRRSSALPRSTVMRNQSSGPTVAYERSAPLICGVGAAMATPLLTLIADVCWFAEMLDPYRVEGLHNRVAIQLIGSLALTCIICAGGISIRFFMIIHSRFNVSTKKAIRALDTLLILTVSAAILRPIAAAADPFAETILTIISSWFWRVTLALFVLGWMIGSTVYNLRLLNHLLPRTRDIEAARAIKRLTHALRVGQVVCTFIVIGTVLSSTVPARSSYLFAMQWYDRSTAIGSSIVMLISMSRRRDHPDDDPLPSYLMPPPRVVPAFVSPVSGMMIGQGGPSINYDNGGGIASNSGPMTAAAAAAAVAVAAATSGGVPYSARVIVSPRSDQSAYPSEAPSSPSAGGGGGGSGGGGYMTTNTTHTTAAAAMRSATTTPTAAGGSPPYHNHYHHQHRTSIHARVPSPSPVASPNGSIVGQNDINPPHLFLSRWEQLAVSHHSRSNSNGSVHGNLVTPMATSSTPPLIGSAIQKRLSAPSLGALSIGTSGGGSVGIIRRTPSPRALGLLPSSSASQSSLSSSPPNNTLLPNGVPFPPPLPTMTTNGNNVNGIMSARASSHMPRSHSFHRRQASYSPHTSNGNGIGLQRGSLKRHSSITDNLTVPLSKMVSSTPPVAAAVSSASIAIGSTGVTGVIITPANKDYLGINAPNEDSCSRV